MSIGVVTCPKDATFKDELVDKADWAMYLAKRRGRDQVMTFAGEYGGETPEQAAVVRPEHVAAMGELAAYFEFYNRRRGHQGLSDRTPYEVYWSTLRTQPAAA